MHRAGRDDQDMDEGTIEGGRRLTHELNIAYQSEIPTIR